MRHSGSSTQSHSFPSLVMLQTHTHPLKRLEALSSVTMHVSVTFIRSSQPPRNPPTETPTRSSSPTSAPTGVEVFVLGHVRAAQCCDEPSDPDISSLRCSRVSGELMGGWGGAWRLSITSHLTSQSNYVGITAFFVSVFFVFFILDLNPFFLFWWYFVTIETLPSVHKVILYKLS